MSVIQFDARIVRRQRTSESGTVALISAFALLVLVGLLGLVIDTAWVQTARGKLQDCADAAALAGAARITATGQIDYDIARLAAHDVAAANTAAGRHVSLDLNATNDPAGDVVVGVWNASTGTFTPTTVSPDSVQVSARFATGATNQALALFFGPIFGVPTSNVAGVGIARSDDAQGPLAWSLSTNSARTLWVRDSASLDASAGGIQVNSGRSCAAQMTGEMCTLLAVRMDVVGTACLSGSYTGQLFEGASAKPDPLASLPEPSTSSVPVWPAITSAGTYSPGYYQGGINLGSGTAVLNPGVYILGNQNPGRGITLTGGAIVSGSGVTLFLRPGARLQIPSGTAGMFLSPPSSGTYAGVSIFQSRGNSNSSAVNGSGVLDVQGTVYFPQAALNLGENARGRIGRILADRVELSGSSRLSITGLGVAPTANAGRAYLVR